MNPRFPLSGAREFPEYISSDRKLSREFQIQRNQTNIPPISKPKIHSLLKRLGVLMLNLGPFTYFIGFPERRIKIGHNLHLQVDL